MNSFGKIFRVSLFGESHGSAIGVIVDGCPAGVSLAPQDFVSDLGRRRSGAAGTTPRHEPDVPEFLSGVYNGFTTGAPLTIITRNSDRISADYDDFKAIPRPGHADFTANVKYGGYSDMRGSGHFSGRITWGLVAAGVVAKKILEKMSFKARLTEAGGSEDIEAAIMQAVENNDSIGGIIDCIASGVPSGLGEPFFYSFESAISHLVFSIPAIKGIEFGAGFAASLMKGSEHNDPFVSKQGKTLTNNAGGINGGISNGNDIIFRVAVKPTSSTSASQETFNFREEKMTTLRVKGRHDTCIALRMPVIVEAAAAIAAADLFFFDRAVNGATRF